MSEPYTQLRKRARSLALATLFDKPAQRDMICDLLLLGLELEKIRAIASEPMLAMIRMQWWYDLFANQTLSAEASDFAYRLYHDEKISNNALLALIEETQGSLQTEQAYVAWPKLYQLIAQANGWQIEPDLLTRLGQNFAKFYQDDVTFTPISDQEILAKSNGRHGFPRLINLLMTRRLKGVDDQDFLLIFRYLFRVLF